MSISRKSILVVPFVLLLFLTEGLADTNLWILSGLAEKEIRVLAIDPHNPSDIYVGTFYKGFFKSMDGGLTWSELSIQNGSFTSIQFDSQTPGILYVLSYSGLFKSTNHGVNWIYISDLPMCNHLVIDPQSPLILYLGIWWAGGSQTGGVLKSMDGGKTWMLMGLEGFDVVRLAIDPENSQVIYAASWNGGMFKSLDGGVTWTSINSGLTNLECHEIALDLNAPETLYAGTSGGAFKSMDSGATWQERNNGITDLRIHLIEIDPYSSQNLCACSWSKVFISADGGDT